MKESESVYKNGDRLKLDFVMPNGVYIVELSSLVKNSKTQNGEVKLGVQFLEDNKEAFEQIRSFFS